MIKATTEVEFSFKGVMYRQIDGVAIGSPLGPVLANIFVGHCESQIDPENWPTFYDRFVDDTFSVFPCRADSEQFFHLLNGLHPALKFTVEEERDGKLPFMDVLVERVTDGFQRSVYRKPTFTGLYTRWDSFAPTSQKINLIRSLAVRAFKICSPSTLDKELANLKDLFNKNGYPSRIVDKSINKAIESMKNPRQPALDCADDKHFVHVRLPWIGRRSAELGKEVQDTVRRSYPTTTPRVVFTTTRAFSGRAKDVLPQVSKSSVVYQFRCCCGQTYVGKTTQRLSERILQHIPKKLCVSRPVLKPVKGDSAITKHLKASPSCISDQLQQTGFTVLAQARSRAHLDVLEALFISRLAPPLCSQKDYVRTLALF